MKRDCPICKGSSAISHVSPEVMPDDEILEDQWSGFLRDKVFYPYYRCECGMLYSKDYPSEERLNQLYSKMANNEHSGDSELEAKTQERYAIQLINLCGRNAFHRVLEIGSDNGRLAKTLNEIARIDEYHCIEPNIGVHQELNTIENVTIFKSIEELGDKKYRYDAVIAIHVIDHIPDVIGLLEKLNHRIKSGGIFYGVVHNEQSLLAKTLKQRWPAYCLQHPHLFNKKTLRTVLERFGFSNITVYRTYNYFNLGYLLEHFFLASFKVRLRFGKIFPVKLKLGNIAIYGKKEMPDK